MMNDWLNGKLKYAFVKSIPVMCGYVFLGIAFGISLQEAGYAAFDFWWNGCVYAVTAFAAGNAMRI